MTPESRFSLTQEELQMVDDMQKKYGTATDEDFKRAVLTWREDAEEAERKYGVDSQTFDREFSRLIEQARQERLAHVSRLAEEQELARRTEREAALPTMESEPMDLDDAPAALPEGVPVEPVREDIRATERVSTENPQMPRQEPVTAARPEAVSNTQNATLSSEHRTPQVPAWYIKLKKLPEKTRTKHYQQRMKDTSKRQVITALSSLKDCLRRCEDARNPQIFEKECNDLRNHIHKAEFLAVDEHILLKAHLLDAGNGLSKIFAPQSIFPWDLKEDALQLYHRWAARRFEASLLRGIITSKTKEDNRSADRLDPSWGKVHTKYHGQGDLVLGQWWPTQLCTVRDGAHGLAQAGIFGEKEKGAYSIIVAGGSGYDDKDMGNEIYYSGTTSKTDVPTDATNRMLESYHNGTEVRVLRSSNLALSNPYRPERGYRYDGLYKVTGYQAVKQEGAIYRFHLVRCPGQNPIRNEKNKPSSRPTKWEIEAYDKEVAERGFRLAMAQK